MFRTSGTVTKGRTRVVCSVLGRTLGVCAVLTAVGVRANTIFGRKTTVAAVPVFGDEASSSATIGPAKTTLTPRIHIPAFITPAISASVAGLNLRFEILSVLPLIRVLSLSKPRRIALFRWQRPHAHRDVPTNKALIRSGKGQGFESVSNLSFAFSIAILSIQRGDSDDFISVGRSKTCIGQTRYTTANVESQGQRQDSQVECLRKLPSICLTQ